MSLFIDSWVNRARSLFDGEAAQKLDTHVRVRDEDGNLLVPTPDPHPQYFNLITDTVWAGMHLTSDVVLLPGAIVAPYDIDIFPPRRMLTDLATGEMTISEEEGGGYQFNLYFTFEAISAGGTYQFELLNNGVGSGLIAVINLSNQSTFGSGVIVGFFPLLSLAGDQVIALQFDEASSKSVTIFDVVWTTYRVSPTITEV